MRVLPTFAFACVLTGCQTAGDNLGTDLGTAHEGRVTAVVYSPDGEWVASAGYDGTVRLWRPRPLAHWRAFVAHGKGVNALAVTGDGRHLISAGNDGKIRIWEMPGGTPRQVLDPPATADCVDVTRDGRRIAAGCPHADAKIVIWEGPGWSTTRAWSAYVGFIRGISFDAAGARLAATGTDERLGDQALKVWNTVDGRLELTLTADPGVRNSVRFTPDGRRLSWVAPDGAIMIREGGASTVLTRALHGVSCTAFSRDGARLAVGLEYGDIAILDAKSGVQRKAFRGHSARVSSLAFSPDGALLASGGSDGAVMVSPADP